MSKIRINPIINIGANKKFSSDERHKKITIAIKKKPDSSFASILEEKMRQNKNR